MSVLAQTSAVVEGVVSKIEFTYTEEEGPWTVVTLTGVTAHLGKAPAQLTIRVVGGPKPNGKWLKVSEHPQFVVNERYVVVLRNTKWFLSPVVNNLAFRVTQVDGAEVLADSEGGIVTSVDANGVNITSAPVFDAPMLNGSTIPAMQPQGAEVAAAARSKLNKNQLLQALKGEATARGLTIAGQFFDVPADGADWRASPVAGTPPVGSVKDPNGPSEPDPFRP